MAWLYAPVLHAIPVYLRMDGPKNKVILAEKKQKSHENFFSNDVRRRKKLEFKAAEKENAKSSSNSSIKTKRKNNHSRS